MDDVPGMTNAESGPAAQGGPSSEPPDPVLISLRIEPGEPITGTLTTSSQAEELPFCGWMELIAGITAAR